MFEGVSLDYFGRLKAVLDSLDHEAIDHAVGLVYEAWQNGKQVIVCGNGGSSLTAQHYITDWNKSIFLSSGKPFHGRCLCENMGLVVAYGNDMGFENIFVEQLKPILNEGDLVIGVSGSGNSENVLKAIEYANENGGITLGVCGYDGGKLRHTAKHQLWANVNDMQLSEDVHAMFGHVVMQTLCHGKQVC